RFSRDWSSDVCSSDLGIVIELHKVKFSTANFTSVMNDPRTTLPNVVYESAIAAGGTSIGQNTLRCHAVVDSPTLLNIASVGLFKIGRASCRESGWVSR